MQALSLELTGSRYLMKNSIGGRVDREDRRARNNLLLTSFVPGQGASSSVRTSFFFFK